MTSPSEPLQGDLFTDRFPELDRLRGTVEINAWHDHDDVYDHTFAVYRDLQAAMRGDYIMDTRRKWAMTAYLNAPSGTRPRREALLLAALFHDIAKPDTFSQTADGQTCCPGHEIRGAQAAQPILTAHGYDETTIARVTTIIANHGRPHEIISPIRTADEIQEGLSLLQQELVYIFPDLLLLALADTQGSQLRDRNPSEYAFRIDCYHRLLNSYDFPVPQSGSHL